MSSLNVTGRKRDLRQIQDGFYWSYLKAFHRNKNTGVEGSFFVLMGKRKQPAEGAH